MIESDYIEANVQKVSLSNMGFVMMLHCESTNETLPIFIGASEAHSISVILNQQSVPRPLSHDLFKTSLDILGARVLKVYITDMSEDTFFAQVSLESNGQIVDIDARPSDAIGLALRFKCPIYVHRDVFREAKVGSEEHSIPQKEEERGKGQLETYREALQKAIQDERYEDAAKLRDQILTLQKHQ